jgi:arginyl-tRNA synthetase
MATSPLSPFRRAAAEVVAAALGVAAGDLVVSTPPDPALGDFAVGCFPAAKTLRAAPAALASRAAAAFVPGDLLEEARASGPYVNLRARREALFRHLFQATLGAGPMIPPVGAGLTVCIDYSSPNIAKHLAYHHIRSTVIGRALCNLHRALGFRVVGINHLGDWGTTFGKLLAACERWGPPEPLTVAGLNELYVRFQRAAKEDAALEAEGRAFFRRLEEGDPALRAQWQRIREISLAEFQEVYDLLGVRFDEVRGESEYERDIPAVIARLQERGLAVVSDGALVVDLSAEGMPPLILRKADGSTIYATRDLAAAIYRAERHGFTRSIYVVDRGQALHFKQLITTLRKAGFAWAEQMEHVSFGLVRLGGKKARTRTGDVILLKDVIAEATTRVRALLAETNPDLPPERADEVARVVGVGVVVFTNLAAQREKDVDFEWEDVVSLRGDAGPYVQYAHARTASLLRAGGVAPEALADADPGPLVREEEWALAKLLCDLGDEVARAAESDEPHIVARYLLDVCAAFSRWYTLGNQDPALKVITADGPATRARLALAAATRATLQRGLGLLGLGAPEVM